MKGIRDNKVWREVVLRVCPGWDDILSCFLFEQGAQGLHVREESQKEAVLAAYFLQEAIPEKNPGRLQYFWRKHFIPRGKNAWSIISVNTIPPQDWTTEWRKDYHPIPVGKKFLIQPSWLPLSKRPSRTVLRMDPGNAFGSGTHASTQLCLLGIEEFYYSGQRALDVGCGSGVLAIAMALQEQKGGEVRSNSKRRIWAIDPDLDAVKTARRNALRNRVKHRIAFYGKALERFSAAPFSLITANLTALDLQNLAPELARLCSSGGLLLLSGLEVRDISSVLVPYRRLGFRKIKTRIRQGWALLVLKRSLGVTPE